MNAAAEIVELQPSCRAYHAGQINGAWESGREAIFTIGRRLIEARRALPHGEFTTMIEKDLKFGPEHARRFMRIAADLRLSNQAYTPVLPESINAMDRLRRLNDEQFEAGIGLGVIHEKMTDAEAAAYLKQVRSDHQHRPLSAKCPPPSRPQRAGALAYHELIYVLVEWRRSKGVSQAALDDRIGWGDGQTSKYEIPHMDDGRIASWSQLGQWMQGLNIGIALVPLD